MCTEQQLHYIPPIWMMKEKCPRARVKRFNTALMWLYSSVPSPCCTFTCCPRTVDRITSVVSSRYNLPKEIWVNQNITKASMHCIEIGQTEAKCTLLHDMCSILPFLSTYFAHSNFIVRGRSLVHGYYSPARYVNVLAHAGKLDKGFWQTYPEQFCSAWYPVYIMSWVMTTY